MRAQRSTTSRREGARRPPLGGRAPNLTTISPDSERNTALAEHKHQQEQFSQYVKATAGASSADELAKLAKPRDDGVISAEEFESQKAKLLA
ncbi:MAG: SHOCT domain-containing protein [Solirubrobacterales bacterium]